MVVEVKAESWLHTEGHSRVLSVSFWRDSASLIRSLGVVEERWMVDLVEGRE